MNWPDVIKEIGIVFTGGSLLVVLLAYLSKTLLTNWMDQAVESHKANLQAANEAAAERLRSDLARQALEHEVKYRRNDEKVAEKLDGLYRKLFTLYNNVCSYVSIIDWSDEPSKDEKQKAVIAANKEFWDYIVIERLYIPKLLYSRTRQLASTLVDIVQDFGRNQKLEQGGHDFDEGYWGRAFNKANDEAAKVFTAVVDEFQQYIGMLEPGDALIGQQPEKIERKELKTEEQPEDKPAEEKPTEEKPKAVADTTGSDGDG